MIRLFGILVLAGLLALANADLGSAFDDGFATAGRDLQAGDYVFLDYFGAPGIQRADNRVGLLVPGCDSPRATLLNVIEQGARTGQELHAALMSRWGGLRPIVNLVDGDSFWAEGLVPAVIECYAQDETHEPQTCTWLVLMRDAPEPSQEFVAGYNYRMLRELTDGESCDGILRSDVRGVATHLEDEER